MNPVLKATVLFSIVFTAFTARADFIERFNDKTATTRDKVTPLSVAAKNFAQDHTWVFVGGLMADLNPSFVSADIAALKSLGVKAQIVKLQPQTEISIQQNAQILYRKLRTISQNAGKKLIVVSHSKGGTESMLGLLWNKKYLLNTDGDFIEALVSVQAPLKGTKLADMGKLVCKNTQLVRDIIGWWDGLCINFELLTRDAMNPIFEKAEASLTATEIQKLNDRVFYVRTYADPSKHPFPISLAAAHLSTFGRNDGVVLTREMKRDAFGTDLGMIEAGHFDLITGDNAPTVKAGMQKRFLSALLGEIAELKGWK